MFEDEQEDEQKPNVVLMLKTSHCKASYTRAILDTLAIMSKCVFGTLRLRRLFIPTHGIILIVRGQFYLLLAEISSSGLLKKKS